MYIIINIHTYIKYVKIVDFGRTVLLRVYIT